MLSMAIPSLAVCEGETQPSILAPVSEWHQQEGDDNDDDDDDNGNYGRGGDGERKKAETSTDSAPPPCKADVQQQQHTASLQRVVTSADMKAEDVDQATPRKLTPGSKWGHRAEYTLGWKTNKVAKVNSYGSFGLGVEPGTWR